VSLDSSRLAHRRRLFVRRPAAPMSGCRRLLWKPRRGRASRPGLEHSPRSGTRDGLHGHDHVDGVARAESKGGDPSGHRGRAARDEASSRIAAWLRPGWRASTPLPGNRATMPQPTRASALVHGRRRTGARPSTTMPFVLNRRQIGAAPVRRTPPALAATMMTAGR
jgi:hypothetical protein